MFLLAEFEKEVVGTNNSKGKGLVNSQALIKAALTAWLF
jgi:hypothetical protein